MESLRLASLGWYGHSNTGDEAFKIALQTLFPTARISFISNIPANQELINNSDYLLIGGGNIVDADFLKGLRLVQVPYSFLGVGLVSGNDLGLLEGAEYVIVRDEFSLGLASTVRDDVVLAPDLAFALAPSAPFDYARPTVGVFLNDCVSAKFDSTILKFIECEKVKLELSRFLEGLPFNVEFIPMSFSPPDDRRISFDVIGKMKRGYKYACLPTFMSPQDCLNRVAGLDFAITMRLHASIFCTIAGVPFMDILHHDKNKGYLQTLELPEAGIDFYELSIKTLEEKFTWLVENKLSISQRLLSAAAQNKRTLEGLIKNVHLSRGRPNSDS